jgi:hypothetical protein
MLVKAGTIIHQYCIPSRPARNPFLSIRNESDYEPPTPDRQRNLGEMSLLSLSFDIIVDIFRELDTRDILRVAMVSSVWPPHISKTTANLFSHQPNTTGFPTVTGGSTYKSWGHNL